MIERKPELAIVDRALVFPTSKVARENYIPRTLYEQKVLQALNNQQAVVLLGRSGIGKSSIAHNIAKQVPANGLFITDCSTLSQSSSQFLQYALDQFDKSLVWYDWVRVGRWFEKRDSFQIGAGGTSRKSDSLFEQRRILLQRLSTRQRYWIIERAERTANEARGVVVDLLNDYGELIDAKKSIKTKTGFIVCTSSSRIQSNSDSSQVDRFRTINIEPMLRGEVTKFVTEGLYKLNVGDPHNMAHKQIFAVSCGVPLAVSEILNKILDNANVSNSNDGLLRDLTIAETHVNEAVGEILSNDKSNIFTSKWNQIVDDESSDLHSALSIMAMSDENPIQVDQLSMGQKERNEFLGAVRTLAKMSMKDNIAGIRVDEDSISFIEPFLFESLKAKLG